jgi:hypothetical protein
MKKIVFFTMFFGLVMVFSGSAAAQEIFKVGDGSVKPAAGNTVRFNIHTRSNSEPGAPKGTKYINMTFIVNGKAVVAGVSQLSPALAKALADTETSLQTITKVENPLVIQKWDTLKFRLVGNKNLHQIEVIRSNKSIGVMKIHTKG